MCRDLMIRNAKSQWGKGQRAENRAASRRTAQGLVNRQGRKRARQCWAEVKGITRTADLAPQRNLWEVFVAFEDGQRRVVRRKPRYDSVSRARLLNNVSSLSTRGSYLQLMIPSLRVFCAIVSPHPHCSVRRLAVYLLGCRVPLMV